MVEARDPLRLVYVANSRIPSRAANTVGVLNMCAGFAAAGAEVELIARGEGDPKSIFDAYGITHSYQLSLLPFSSHIGDKLRFARFIRSRVAAGRARRTLVFGRSSYGLLLGVPRRQSFVFDVHSWPATAAERVLERLLFTRSNFLFLAVTTQQLAEDYQARYPALRKRVLVSTNGAPVPRVTAADVSAAASRPGRLQVYYTGHLYAGRGIELLLEIARREPTLDFHFVGGEDRDVERCRAVAPANAHFHGYVVPSMLHAHYEKADVCVAPYQTTVRVAGGSGDNARWMSPLKLFEYMAQGKPIVASDLPAIREVLTSGEDAILCPPDDADAWRSALATLRDDSALRRKLGQASLTNASTRYSWRGRAEAVLNKARTVDPSLR